MRSSLFLNKKKSLLKFEIVKKTAEIRKQKKTKNCKLKYDTPIFF